MSLEIIKRLSRRWEAFNHNLKDTGDVEKRTPDEAAAPEPPNHWIQDISKGKDFVDLGGLWGTVNERVTVAALAGARSSTMVDIMPREHPLWNDFLARCAEQGVAASACIPGIDINDPELVTKVGQYDVVHCSGIIYHCPNPVHTVNQLAQLAKEYLIIGSTVISPKISNSAGQLVMEDNAALFVPGITEHQKAVVSKFFEEVGAKMIGINLPLTSDWDMRDYSPWWYLLTPGFVSGLLNACGFDTIDAGPVWQGRSAYVLGKRKTR